MRTLHLLVFLSSPQDLMNALKAVGGFVSSVFWGLGVAGCIGLNIPYLTDEDAFVFVQGNRLDGGWGFNYSMAVAFALSIVSILKPFSPTALLPRRHKSGTWPKSPHPGSKSPVGQTEPRYGGAGVYLPKNSDPLGRMAMAGWKEVSWHKNPLIVWVSRAHCQITT